MEILTTFSSYEHIWDKIQLGESNHDRFAPSERLIVKQSFNAENERTDLCGSKYVGCVLHR